MSEGQVVSIKQPCFSRQLLLSSGAKLPTSPDAPRHFSLGGKKKSIMFWKFLHLKAKLAHKIKAYIIQCQKLVIYRNHPSFIFSNTEKKKTWFNNSVFGSLANTVCIIQNKRSQRWARQWAWRRTGTAHGTAHESSIVQTQGRTRLWRLCEGETRCPITICIKRPWKISKSFKERKHSRFVVGFAPFND